MTQAASKPIAGSITAKPNPLPPEAESPTTVRWEINTGPAEVCVSDNGAPEKLVARGTSGSLDLAWIRAGRNYDFRLYSSKGPRQLLDEVKVYRNVFGRLTLTPNPDPFSADGKTLVEWEITQPAIAAVYLSEDGGPERIVCRGESGSIELSGLHAGVEYLFRLYTNTESRQLLDEARLFYNIKGRIAATPNPDPFSADGKTLVEWEITQPAIAAVYLSEDGGPERIVCRGESGSIELSGLHAGVEYLFRLYTNTESRQLLDEARLFYNIKGRIAATPNPDPFSPDGKTLVEWEITQPATAAVYLSEDGGPEKIVCRGESGSIELSGLHAGVEYLFRLYTNTESRQLLDEARLFYDIKGRIAATPNPIPVESGSKTMLKWEITPPALAEIRVSEDGVAERTVCVGASGSFEVTGLRSGIEYLFRLYTRTEVRQLLDEETVRLSDIPWAALLERLKSGIGGKDYSTGLAEFIAGTLSGCLHHREFSQWFQLWEANGFHVTPVHFYEPIPDSQTLPAKLWEETRELVGIDMNKTMQLHLLHNAFPKFKEEYDLIPAESSDATDLFYLNNGRFAGIDPMIAYCMVRHFKPCQIIEVGGGHSTLLLAQAAGKNRNTTLLTIEPYPEDFLTEGQACVTSLLAKKVEDVDLSYFLRLEAGDCLFIDTSHVVRIGGDVNFLFLEVLPRLKPGVIIHVHDIFLPLEYPRRWVIEQRRFWTEQYLLQAFLTFNSEFEVLVSSGYLKAYHPEELKATFPACSPWQGGSFWMRRVHPS